MSWWLLALLSSFASAFNGGMNRHFKVDGARLTLWAAVVQVALVLPAAFLVPLPGPAFALAAVATGVLLCIFDIALYNVASRYGGPVIPRVLALRIWILFFIWAAIDHEYTMGLLAQPALAAGILGALALGSACLFFMTRCALTRQAAVALMPALVTSVAMTLIVKVTLSAAPPGLGTVALFTLITCVVEVATCLAWLLYRRRDLDPQLRPPLLRRAYIAPALAIGASCVITRVLRAEAIVLAPNPAYVFMVALLSAVWLYLAHMALRMPDTRQPWPGFGLVASSGVLIYLSL